MKIFFITLMLMGLALVTQNNLVAFDFGGIISKGVSKAVTNDNDGDDIGKLKSVGGISLKEELEIGGSLAAEIAGRNGGILKDATLTKRVALIGKVLVTYSSRPELPWTFAVLDNSSVNAFSCPGGYVFVTKALVDSCSNDAELAGLLAHEIAHVTGRHALKVIAGGDTSEGLGALASLSGYDYGAGELIGKGAKSIITNGYSANKEFDADCDGTRLVYDTGFPPTTLRNYLSKLAKSKTDKPFKTHPPTQERVEKLNDYLPELEQAKEADIE